MAIRPLLILAIDDNPDNLVALQAVLTTMIPESRIVTARDGHDGISLAREHDPDVILLDVIMPGMDGFAVCRAIKGDAQLQGIPVVFLTAARTGREIYVKALDAGGEAFLTKPIDDVQLVAQVRAMAKIREAARRQVLENDRLAALVAQRTAELEAELSERRGAEADLQAANESLRQSQAGTISLLEDLGAEIAKREETERAQRETETRYRLILERMMDAFALVDIVRDDQGRPTDCRFVSVNPAFERITGLPAGRVIGQPVSEVLPKTEQFWLEVFSHVVRTGKSVRFERHSTVLGKWLEVEAFTTDQGQLGTIFEDITECKLAQAALQEAKEAAETANQAKDHFIAVVSHELRTPLTPVLMAIGAMELHRNLHPDLRRYIRIMGQNIDLETRLIDDLLNLTRLQSGKILLDLNLVDVHACLLSSLEICRAAADAKQIRIVVDFRAQRHHISGDSMRLKQVFWNLITNATKFTPESGTITLRSSEDGPSIHIHVADTGIGMDPHLVPRIFRPFEQGDISQRRKYGGMGLGLAIAKGLIELHKGAISANSPGRNLGSTFTVTVPLADVPGNGLHHAHPAEHIDAGAGA